MRVICLCVNEVYLLMLIRLVCLCVNEVDLLMLIRLVCLCVNEVDLFVNEVDFSVCRAWKSFNHRLDWRAVSHLYVHGQATVTSVMYTHPSPQVSHLLLLLGCSLSVLIEQTSTLEEGNRRSRAVPEVSRTEWLCV